MIKIYHDDQDTVLKAVSKVINAKIVNVLIILPRVKGLSDSELNEIESMQGNADTLIVCFDEQNRIHINNTMPFKRAGFICSENAILPYTEKQIENRVKSKDTLQLRAFNSLIPGKTENAILEIVKPELTNIASLIPLKHFDEMSHDDSNSKNLIPLIANFPQGQVGNKINEYFQDSSDVQLQMYGAYRKLSNNRRIFSLAVNKISTEEVVSIITSLYSKNL